MSTKLLLKKADAAVLRWQDDEDFVISGTQTITEAGEVIAMGSGLVEQVSADVALPEDIKPFAYTWDNGSFVAREPDPDPLADLSPLPEKIGLDDGPTRVPVSKFQQVFLTRTENLRLELFALGEDEAGQPVDAAVRHLALVVKGYLGTNPYVNLEREEHQALVQELADSGVLLGPWRVAQILKAEMPAESDPNPNLE